MLTRERFWWCATIFAGLHVVVLFATVAVDGRPGAAAPVAALNGLGTSVAGLHLFCWLVMYERIRLALATHVGVRAIAWLLLTIILWGSNGSIGVSLLERVFESIVADPATWGRAPSPSAYTATAVWLLAEFAVAVVALTTFDIVGHIRDQRQRALVLARPMKSRAIDCVPPQPADRWQRSNECEAGGANAGKSW